MLRLVRGNLLEADVEAVVNTVNTVGVMGKGIALAFRSAYPENYRLYAAACKAGDVRIGRMFVTGNRSLHGPRWIVNFPTKKHWRHPSRLDWIREGLDDLSRVIREQGIRSIAIPPLGCGHGGLEWAEVRSLIEIAAEGWPNVNVQLFEPTARYLTPRKNEGVASLTPARALVLDAVRRYSVLGIECFNLEVQKLAYFVERAIADIGMENPLRLDFRASRYGPYSDRLRHVLDGLDGSWLQSEKRLADSGPFDRLWFESSRGDELDTYLRDEVPEYGEALSRLGKVIDGFESPLGMELLATVDWLLRREGASPTPESLGPALERWPGGPGAGARKRRLFDDSMLALAGDHLSTQSGTTTGTAA